MTQLTSSFDGSPLDPPYYTNGYGIAVDLFDVYYAPGQSWRWVETGLIYNDEGDATGFMGIEGCDGCTCLQYGAGDQYLKVQIHPGDMTNEFPPTLDNGQG